MINFRLYTFYHNAKKCKIALKKKVGSKRENPHKKEKRDFRDDARDVPGQCSAAGRESNQPDWAAG